MKGIFINALNKSMASLRTITEKSIKILIKDSKSFIFYMKGREEKRYNFYLRKVFGG